MTEVLVKQFIGQTTLPYSELEEEGDIWVYAGEHRIGVKSTLLGGHLKGVQGRINRAGSRAQVEIQHGVLRMDF